jgi:hypothetical protein
VRARAPDPDAHRRDHVLPVGQHSPVHADRQRAPSAAVADSGRGRPGRPRGRRARRALGPRRASGPGRDRHQRPAAAAARRAGDLLHPGAGRLASRLPLTARARPGHGGHGQVGALHGPEHGPAAARLGAPAPYRRGGRPRGPDHRLLASAGGSVLVWTGLALAWRRLRNWRRRAGSSEPILAPEARQEVSAD